MCCSISGDTPITFVGNSYARWTLHDPIDTRLSLSMRIKTLRETASLMFAKGRVDYSILEVGGCLYIIVEWLFTSSDLWAQVKVSRNYLTLKMKFCFVFYFSVVMKMLFFFKVAKIFYFHISVDNSVCSIIFNTTSAHVMLPVWDEKNHIGYDRLLKS